MIRILFVLLLASIAARLAAQSVEVDRLLDEGDSLLVSERYGKALDRFNDAIEIESTARTYSARSKAYYAMDRFDRFLIDVERSLEIDSTYAEANYHRALYALRGEDHKATVRYSTRALDGNASDGLRGKLLLIRGEALSELHQHDRAINDLRAGLDVVTGDLQAHKVLARSLDAVGRHDEALVVLESLCALEPENVGNWVNRGFELANMGRYEEALAMYNEALSIDKDEPVALSDRAYALLQLGQVDQAWRDVEKSLRFYPSNAYALRTRALLRLRKGDRDKACSDLSLARILGGVDNVDQLIQEHCVTTKPER